MPIVCPIPVRNLTKPEFDERDRIVMHCAYDSQNALGRLCDERVYENDLARRLRAEGFREVHSQVPITLSHCGFHKEYRLDLLADDALYELKTTTAFTSEHDAQKQTRHVDRLLMLSDFNAMQWLNFHHETIRFQTLTR